jgi:ATP-dependent Clp protease ATP-binding subunit ClpC
MSDGNKPKVTVPPLDPCIICSKKGVGKLRDEVAKERIKRRSLESQLGIVERKLSLYEKAAGHPRMVDWLVRQVEKFEREYFDVQRQFDEEKIQSSSLSDELSTLAERLKHTETYRKNAVKNTEIYKDRVEKLKEQIDSMRDKARKKGEESPIRTLTDEEVREYSRIIRKNISTIDTDMAKIVKGQERMLVQLKKKLVAGSSGLREDIPITMFLHGPTGCGKTYTVEVLNELLYKGLPVPPELMILNGGDYKARHEISKLKGSPPGYVGHDQDGKFVRHIKNNPVFSIVLIDEVEKAHPAFFEYLLRPLDKGDMEDGKNDTYRLNKYIVLMTSNIGEHFAERKKSISGFSSDFQKSQDEARKGNINEVVRSVFPPEFLNRINARLHFDFLSDEAINDILDLELEKINDRAFNEYTVEIDFTEDAKAKLIDLGFSRKYGARKLKRTIEDHIQGEEQLVQLLDTSLFIIVDYKDDRFTYSPIN